MPPGQYKRTDEQRRAHSERMKAVWAKRKADAEAEAYENRPWTLPDFYTRDRPEQPPPPPVEPEPLPPEVQLGYIRRGARGDFSWMVRRV